MIREAIKSSVQDLAMAGLKRLAFRYIENNPYRRMHQVSKDVFGSIDHKQMLASVVVRQLVNEGKVVKYQPIKMNKGVPIRDQFGQLVRYKHFVYVPNERAIA